MKNFSTTLIAFLLLTSLGLGIFYYIQQSKDHGGAGSGINQASDDHFADQEEPDLEDRQELAGEIKKEGEKIVTPTLSDIHKDAEDDPHTTPQALLGFAGNIGVRMEEAAKQEVKATLLFEELADCALEDSDITPVSARALCLSNAKILSEKYPDALSDKFKAVQKNVSPDVLKLFKNYQKIKK